MATYQADPGSGVRPNITLTTGTTTKILVNTGTSSLQTSVGALTPQYFDFIVKVQAGESIVANAGSLDVRCCGVAKQIADISGNLT